ncbi:MAG: TfoX-like protein [candidate division TM6 bacterium GW2011_GWE2_42_60]|nr:MAG: TfoX-like protein [candidate division TM6 bacterium GW2011_GWE2_42_60]HBY05339.1 competence protein TfoX [Candidatus Dependentiae bacterium]
MSSTQAFVDFIISQAEGAGHVTFRKMFGEYGIYCNSKFVALICDDNLFIKPTKSGRAFIENVTEAPPYPGAKLWFLIEDKYENQDWLSNLFKITAEELPVPKPKVKK